VIQSVPLPDGSSLLVFRAEPQPNRQAALALRDLRR